MKMLQKWLMIAGVMLACNAPAADAGPSVTYSGTVVNAQGQPVTNAEVDFYQYPGQLMFGTSDLVPKKHLTTDGKGAFSFSSPQTATIVVVKKAGLAPTWKTWTSTPANAPETLIIAAPTTLAGIVVDENGQPVPNADVWVSLVIAKSESENGWSPNMLFGKSARECFSARTSADGRFRIANFPTGAQANLAVGKTGKALRPITSASSGMGISLPFDSGREDIKLVLDPAGSLEGKVTVKETGQPVPGAKLRLQSEGFSALQPSEAVTSGADGTFRITDVSAGSYKLIAVFDHQPLPDWVANSVPVTVKVGETTRNLQVQVTKGGILEVTVVGKDDKKPIANVNVYAYGGETVQANTLTSDNGISVMRLPPGQFTVVAMQESRPQAQASTAITAGQTNRVRLEFTSPLKITGTVRDASGKPVAGVQISVLPNFSGQGAEIKTDASGHYEVTWQLPEWALGNNQKFFMIARSLDLNQAVMHEVDTKTTTLDLTLKPGTTISGQVKDPNGNAIINAMGYLMLYTENSGFSLNNNQSIKADDHGRFEITALPAGERYGAMIMAKGHGSVSKQMTAADTKTDPYEFPTFVLKIADRKLAGRVLGSDGKPVAGVQVSIQGGGPDGSGQPQGFTRSETDGRFAFEAVCEGPISLYANFQSDYGNARASGGDTNVTIRLGANNAYNQASTPPVTITGTVLDASGKPASGVSMVVTPAFGMVRGEVKTDADGHYKVDWQPEQRGPNSKYFLIARDLDRNLAVAQEINDKLTSLDLRLQTGFSLSGTVQDADGAPLSRASVNLNFMAGNSGGMVDRRPVQTDAQGGFTIASLPTGQRYSVRVSATGYGSASKQVSQAETQNGNVELPPFKLKLANLQLAGQVLGADDKPVSGAQVMVNGQGQPNSNTRSDANGHFNLKVCDGPLTIIAFNPQGGSSQGNVQARGGDTNVVVKMGARQARNAQSRPRLTPLKEQPWTWQALTHWPATHKRAATVLLCVQIVILAGTAGGIFWITRKRRP